MFKRVPMGMKTSPACFNAMMAKVFDGLDYVGLYLDDIVIASATFEDNMTHLTEVLHRLQIAGLTVKLRKCDFACNEIEYLGHKVGLGQIHLVN
jgi:hypothetical protein